MVQSIINMEEKEDRILNIVKAQHGFKNKSQALAFILKVYGESFLEPELRPEYLERLEKIRKEKHTRMFTSIDELRNHIEKNA